MGATPARRARPQSEFEIVTMYERSEVQVEDHAIVRGEIADSADVRRYVRRGEVWWSWVVGACWSPGRRVAPGRGGRWRCGRCARRVATPDTAAPAGPVGPVRLRPKPNSNTVAPQSSKIILRACRVVRRGRGRTERRAKTPPHGRVLDPFTCTPTGDTVANA